jgi:hypothetical protein
MRAEERFEYRGYVIDVLADYQASGEWDGSYLILKDGDQVASTRLNQIGLHNTVTAAQDYAIQEAKKMIDTLIGRDSNGNLAA